jgi:hypothetical protein
MAFYETVIVKGYEILVDSGTTVDVSTGMIAACRLQALIESRASGTRIADLMVQMDRIINAIHSPVPEELWPEILARSMGPVAADTPARMSSKLGTMARTSSTPWNPQWQIRTAGHDTHDEPEHRPHVHRACSDTRSRSACTAVLAWRRVLWGSPSVVVRSAPATLLRTVPYARPTQLHASSPGRPDPNSHASIFSGDRRFSPLSVPVLLMGSTSTTSCVHRRRLWPLFGKDDTTGVIAS